MLVAGRTPPSISWWQTRAGWQSLVKTAAAGGGGRRPVFTRDCHAATLGHRGRRSSVHVATSVVGQENVHTPPPILLRSTFSAKWGNSNRWVSVKFTPLVTSRTSAISRALAAIRSSTVGGGHFAFLRRLPEHRPNQRFASEAKRPEHPVRSTQVVGLSR